MEQSGQLHSQTDLHLEIIPIPIYRISNKKSGYICSNYFMLLLVFLFIFLCHVLFATFVTKLTWISYWVAKVPARSRLQSLRTEAQQCNRVTLRLAGYRLHGKYAISTNNKHIFEAKVWWVVQCCRLDRFLVPGIKSHSRLAHTAR
jgi:hypothetical protein